MQVYPIKPKVKPLATKRLALQCDILLSTSAFKLNLRRYIEVKSQNLRLLVDAADAEKKATEIEADLSIAKAGRCRLTPA